MKVATIVIFSLTSHAFLKRLWVNTFGSESSRIAQDTYWRDLLGSGDEALHRITKMAQDPQFDIALSALVNGEGPKKAAGEFVYKRPEADWFFFRWIKRVISMVPFIEKTKDDRLVDALAVIFHDIKNDIDEIRSSNADPRDKVKMLRDALSIKLKQRYDQLSFLAQGIADKSGKPVNLPALDEAKRGDLAGTLAVVAASATAIAIAVGIGMYAGSDQFGDQQFAGDFNNGNPNNFNGNGNNGSNFNNGNPNINRGNNFDGNAGFNG